MIKFIIKLYNLYSMKNSMVKDAFEVENKPDILGADVNHILIICSNLNIISYKL